MSPTLHPAPPGRLTRRDPHRALAQVSAKLVAASAEAPADILARLGSAPHGLTEFEVTERLERFGPNQVAHERPPSALSLLWRAARNPFIGILAVLTVVSLGTDVVFTDDPDPKTVIVLSLMITLSAGMRFVQEFRANHAAESLRTLVRTTCSVRRRVQPGAPPMDREIPLEELVPGDVVTLAAGDMVPADVRLLETKDLFVSQAVLTGESLPVEKYDTLGAVVEKSAHGRDATDATAGALELENVCFMGTNVVSGSATAVVVATGNGTYFGSMARALLGHRAPTSFDKGVNSVSLLLIRFMLVMAPTVFVVNWVTKGDWIEAALFGLAVAVGLTPEMLPMIVTANLARGAVRMARRKSVVKRLNAIQNLGAMDVLCTDKTGTLTQDHIVLELHHDVTGKESLRVLELGYLNSLHQTGLRNLLDRAILDAATDRELTVDPHARKVDEIPFDFNRRRMSVVIEEGDAHLLVCKGAIEEMLALARALEIDGEVVPATPESVAELYTMTDRLNLDGLRVLAVGYRRFEGSDRRFDAEGRPAYRVDDEAELVIAGFLGFLDPPKETAGPAVRALADYGVRTKILTGDNDLVTLKVCRDIGLPVAGVLLGSDLEQMSDEELKAQVTETTVFAKLAPLQKTRVVRALQATGHTVGYLGDGINDASALRDADVGISVDSGTDIAKESSDIILLEKSLLVLEEGVIEGRRVFGNIMKYIKMTASSNFGNVFSVMVASIFLPFLPMLPVMLLLQNLMYDTSMMTIPWDRVDREYLAKPQKWNAPDIGRFMIRIGPISSIFDITTYLVMWFVFAANTVEMQSLFQSGWFVEGLLSQTLVVHMIRTRHVPFFQSRAALPLMLTTGLACLVGLVVPFTSFGASIGMVPLPASYFPWLVATLLGYCLLTQFIKGRYIRANEGRWL
jgi:Mg2+-importing ATPase